MTFKTRLQTLSAGFLLTLAACGSAPTTVAEVSSPAEVQLLESNPNIVRIMAANTTSGSNQAYQAPGVRIFQALEPDIVLIQEFDYDNGSIDDLVDDAFGSAYTYFRESTAGDGGGALPNGVISRYPIVASGEWEDDNISNRDFAWARINVPGPTNLWVVSVHWKAGGGDASRRSAQSSDLVNYINQNVPAGDFVVVGGDFNTSSRGENSLNTLDQVVDTDGPYPVDQQGDPDTNSNRNSPYDAVYVEPALANFEVPVVIGSNSFPNGLVFDSRTYTPLSEVAPVQFNDSGVSGMQHMAVVRDFNLGSSTPTPTPTPAPTPTPIVSGTPFTVPGNQAGYLSVFFDQANPTRIGTRKDDYALQGLSTGQSVTVNLSSNRFDAYLQLINGVTGSIIAENDDFIGSDSRLTFAAQAGTSYVVRVTHFNGRARGFYTLSVN